MPVPLTFTEIKALTQVGDSPTNTDRADVWDSIAYYIQQAEDKAEAAEADVAAAIATLAQTDFFPVLAFCKFTTGGSLANGTYWTPTEQLNVTTVGMDTGTGRLRITFGAANADTNYKVEYYTRRLGVETGTTLEIYAENANWVEFLMTGAGPHTLRDFFIIIRQDWSV